MASTKLRTMPAADFVSWQARMGLSDKAAAEILEVSRNTVAQYRVSGAPRHIALACSAYAMGLPPWGSIAR